MVRTQFSCWPALTGVLVPWTSGVRPDVLVSLLYWPFSWTLTTRAGWECKGGAGRLRGSVQSMAVFPHPAEMHLSLCSVLCSSAQTVGVTLTALERRCLFDVQFQRVEKSIDLTSLQCNLRNRDRPSKHPPASGKIKLRKKLYTSSHCFILHFTSLT